MDSAVRDVLVGLKSKLSEGWIQGELESGEGVCLFGALIKTGGMRVEYGGCASSVKGRGSGAFVTEPMWTLNHASPAGRAMTLIAEEAGVPDLNDLALWNDEKGRTVNDITGVIDRILLRGIEKPKRGILRRLFVHERELVEV